ncbi:methylated-DNA--[protein]-cysteine S-methyltransferase [Arhodomonas aquaeolei]|uniref:methylated-DNA--[protein]-cysteine S-methyltransferase n=1 Tax=Arhodomonas aquaeolei TaxID=2369 RepID=UPI00036132FA|nr:methylated-DNA--[protein]-cysteine S-methyltransferase [Arhodomonas aquaeolei]
MTLRYTLMDSPIGELLLAGDGYALTRLDLRDPGDPRPDPAAGWQRDDTAFTEARAQLDAYFAGDREGFDLALAPAGTAFQRRVWDALLAIPYGETASYGDVARRLGTPGAARAVGLANNRNPIAVIIPCHRVIGADGSLTGYGGGLERKRWLLAHERRFRAVVADAQAELL